MKILEPQLQYLDLMKEMWPPWKNERTYHYDGTNATSIYAKPLSRCIKLSRQKQVYFLDVVA